MWRERLLTVLMVPVLLLPVLVIAAGGDVDILWNEIRALTREPVVVTVYAQLAPSPTVAMASPTVMMTPLMSPTVAMGSPTVTFPPPTGAPGTGNFTGDVYEAPLLTRWGYISASIILALLGFWVLSDRKLSRRRQP